MTARMPAPAMSASRRWPAGAASSAGQRRARTAVCLATTAATSSSAAAVGRPARARQHRADGGGGREHVLGVAVDERAQDERAGGGEDEHERPALEPVVTRVPGEDDREPGQRDQRRERGEPVRRGLVPAEQAAEERGGAADRQHEAGVARKVRRGSRGRPPPSAACRRATPRP